MDLDLIRLVDVNPHYFPAASPTSLVERNGIVGFVGIDSRVSEGEEEDSVKIFAFFSPFFFSSTGLKRSEHSRQVLVHGQLLCEKKEEKKKCNERIISRERLKSNKEKGHQPGGPCI